MIVPIGHEDLRGRRWPFVTIAILALNLIAFFSTNWTLEAEAEKLRDVKVQILVIAAAFPDVEMPADVKKFVGAFEKSNPKLFESMRSGKKQPEMALEIELLDWEASQAHEEMAALAAEFERLTSDSLLSQYAYVPYEPSTISLVTANFLHGGWLHLIFNMWFLWLAGTVVEDAWGRLIYPAFFLVAGVVAVLAHAISAPNSSVPLIGASGAVAGLMGAFLMLLPKTKIQFVVVYFLGVWPRFLRFSASTYLMLPLWLGSQVLWATLDRGEGGIAYWSHIGGFGFGVVVALVMKATGIHKKVDAAIEEKVSWSVAPEIAAAGDLLDQGNAEQAIEGLQAFVAKNASSIEAQEMLLQAYWKTQDMSAQRETLVTLCRLHWKSNDMDAAWKDYEEFSNLGGVNFPPDIWQEMCRYLEAQHHYERAAVEYETLAKSHPQHRASVAALVAAGRIRLRKLGDRGEAAKLYKAAAESKVPHLDWDGAIEAGLKECSGEPVAAGVR